MKKYQKTLKIGESEFSYFSLDSFKKEEIQRLPISIRILLESLLRKYDGKVVQEQHITQTLNWGKGKSSEIPFYPSRVLLQDFTGVPAVVDLASLREAIAQKDPSKVKEINPQVPVELVIDHSIQVDQQGTQEALKFNEDKEFDRNKERFRLLKWGQKAFTNMKIVPPGSGIVHQVNLESLARVVFGEKVLYPDSLIGTDSHTTMINSLGVLGWGVGGIEAEAVMLGEFVSMVLPEVVGVEVSGTLPEGCCATDVVLKLTNLLRQVGVVGKFVEFFGNGLDSLSLPDRATLSNMSPEYGATMGFFPVDQNTLDYLVLTGREKKRVQIIKEYLQKNQLFRQQGKNTIEYTKVVQLKLNEIVPVVAGPKRPQDMIPISELYRNFHKALTSKVGFNGFAVKEEILSKKIDCGKFTLENGSILIAAITSCTNTSNPFVLIAAGLLAKKAVQQGLKVPEYVKTSLSPGSKVVTEYLQKSGLQESLNKIGFQTVGYGCMTCIGNSGDLLENIKEIVQQNKDMVFASVLSGNRNFEGRIHSLSKANYLCAPIYVVAYALAGKIIDFEKSPLGKNTSGKDIFLKDIFPTSKEINQYIKDFLNPAMFVKNYEKILEGNEKWKSIDIKGAQELYPWDSSSTYIKNPPYFDNIDQKLPKSFENLHCLLLLGDTITTDHISPAGKIATKSDTADYLRQKGVERRDFNSYGSRRGNHEVMMRGTFGNLRIKNELVEGEEGPLTILNDKKMTIFKACQELKFLNMIVIAGKEYGTGSSRDWAGKGPSLLGVKVVIAESYERIHRSNLVGMGVLPLQFIKDTRNSLKLTGKEKFSVDLSTLAVKGEVRVTTSTGKSFPALVRIDTDPEMSYFKSGGILVYVLKKILQK